MEKLLTLDLKDTTPTVRHSGNLYSNMAGEFIPDSTAPVDTTTDVGNFQPHTTIPLAPDEQEFANAKDSLAKYDYGDPSKEGYTLHDVANLENLAAQHKPI